MSYSEYLNSVTDAEFVTRTQRELKELIDSRERVADSRNAFMAENKILKADNARMLTHATNVTNLHNAAAALSDKKIGKLTEENERLRNRIAKLQSLGGDAERDSARETVRLRGRIDEITKERYVLKTDLMISQAQAKGLLEAIDGLHAQIDELTKHNHALSERAKRAEGSFTAPYVTINGFHYYLGESK
jgi:chromosome segregation ATPase